MIRPHLFDAIKGLGPLSKTRVLWIDEVSINQTDDSERESQVRQFGLIFSKASRLHIWLREANWSHLKLAFQLLETLSREARTVLDSQPAPTPPFTRSFDSVFNPPSANAPEYVALRKLMQN